MPVEIKVPAAGESVTEGILSRWLKKDGDYVKADEPVVELETDKATQEVPAPAARRRYQAGCAGGPQRERQRGAARRGAGPQGGRARDAAAAQPDPPAHRRPTGRIPTNDRVADDLQRGRPDRRQRDAREVQGQVQ